MQTLDQTKLVLLWILKSSWHCWFCKPFGLQQLNWRRELQWLRIIRFSRKEYFGCHLRHSTAALLKHTGIGSDWEDLTMRGPDYSCRLLRSERRTLALLCSLWLSGKHGMVECESQSLIISVISISWWTCSFIAPYWSNESFATVCRSVVIHINIIFA